MTEQFTKDLYKTDRNLETVTLRKQMDCIIPVILNMINSMAPGNCIILISLFIEGNLKMDRKMARVI